MKNNFTAYPIRRKSRQEGAVLIFSLVYLIVLTLIAVTGMETTVVEERMAGNMQDYNQAFQAAEVAMEDAEVWLAGESDLPDSPDPDADSFNDEWWWERDDTWWTTNGDIPDDIEAMDDDNKMWDPDHDPRYYIEEYFSSTAGQSLTLGTGEYSNIPTIHRITVRGVGNSKNSQVLLQSTYINRYD